jgi:iron(III) transport system substrate-binding protein
MDALLELEPCRFDLASRFRRPLLLAAILLGSCGPRDGVTVYTSIDEGYARPILERFEAETGIKVYALYDVEAQKTTGLFQRLLAERARPRADVFWNSEVARTIQLECEGLLAPAALPAARVLAWDPAPPGGGLWHAGPRRARVLLYNRERWDGGPPPRSIAELADPRFRGQAAIARPLFGTTATHAGALRARLGEQAFAEFFQSLRDNQVRLVEGNATVRNLVARGEVVLGLTDSDDAHEALLRGDPVEIVYPDQEAAFPGLEEPLGTFLIPSSAALIARGPRPELGKRLLEYLLGEEAERLLVESSAAFLPARGGGGRSSLQLPERLIAMEVDWDEAAGGIEASREFLKHLFLR